MALIKCSECGKEISDRASSCPNCGCPIDNVSKKRINKKIIIVFLVAILFICIFIFFHFRSRIPDGYTKEYYQEAKEFVMECEKYINDPSDEIILKQAFIMI